MTTEEPPHPPVVHERKSGGRRRARIAVRGLDRDPHLARRVVEQLEQLAGVTARASVLTGRVLVEYDESETPLSLLLAAVSEVELPELPGEDRPAHPLDPAPLVQSMARTAGAGAGLALLAAWRLSGHAGRPPGARPASVVAGVLGLLRGFPFIRNGLRRLVGKDLADVAFGLANIVSLAFAGSPVGLALIGAEAALLLREVLVRRAAWRRYEARLAESPAAEPGKVIRLEPGDTAPLGGRVTEGAGIALGRDGMPRPVGPGSHVFAGARLLGGPFEVALEAGQPFVPQPRPAPPAPSLYSRYFTGISPAALAYAALTALITRSPLRAFHALLLVNPRPAVIGMEAANINAAARVLRGGVTVVGTRRGRPIRRPHLLLLDGPRTITDGLEVAGAVPLRDDLEAAALVSLAAAVAAAAGSPWGNGFPRAGLPAASEGSFEDGRASAVVEGVRHVLKPAEQSAEAPEVAHLRKPGSCLLVLRREGEGRPLGVLSLRPRLSPSLPELIDACRTHGVKVGLVGGGDPEAAKVVAHRAKLPIAPDANIVAAVRRAQERGAVVAVVSDSADAGEAFDNCDLAIALLPGKSARFPARADLLVTDLGGVAAVIEAGARRNDAVRDSVLLSAASNLFGAVWGLRSRPGVERASLGVYVSAIASLADGLLRLAGGKRPGAALAYLIDPRPERWGRRSADSVLRTLRATPDGLSSAEAARRRRREPARAHRNEAVAALIDQLRYPTTGILAGAAGLSLLYGAPLDFAVIAATIGLNVAVGYWQERQADRAAEALKRLGTATARVLRDGRPVVVPAAEVVSGDVRLLSPGDRVAADARGLEAQGLEVDEAVLTGESLPVPKVASDGPAEAHVVLEGSDVAVGSGRAVVFAVGRNTRMGATAAALDLEEAETSPLGARLSRLLWQSLPLTAAASGGVVLSGLLRGRPMLGQLAIGATMALAAVPEGLPMLAGLGQAGVARRLASRNALVRRLAAVEALGRVDVACADKTGTMTQGRLALVMVADSEQELRFPDELGDGLRHVLLTAALASPHPEAAGATAHPTDVAVVRAASAAGLGDELRRERQAEAPFAPARSFHAAVVRGRLCVKGAPEVLLPCCNRVRRAGREAALDDAARQALADRAEGYAGRGLRVPMVAEGPADARADDPEGLTALGFVGIRDPLRPTVPAAVRRCHEAGVRVVMITGATR